MSPSTFFVILPVTDSCDLGAFHAAFSNLGVLLANTACQPVFIFSSRRFGIPFLLPRFSLQYEESGSLLAMGFRDPTWGGQFLDRPATTPVPQPAGAARVNRVASLPSTAIFRTPLGFGHISLPCSTSQWQNCRIRFNFRVLGMQRLELQ
jgi:hypothetical protein